MAIKATSILAMDQSKSMLGNTKTIIINQQLSRGIRNYMKNLFLRSPVLQYELRGSLFDDVVIKQDNQFVRRDNPRQYQCGVEIAITPA